MQIHSIPVLPILVIPQISRSVGILGFCSGSSTTGSSLFGSRRTCLPELTCCDFCASRSLVQLLGLDLEFPNQDLEMLSCGSELLSVDLDFGSAN